MTELPPIGRHVEPGDRAHTYKPAGDAAPSSSGWAHPDTILHEQGTYGSSTTATSMAAVDAPRPRNPHDATVDRWLKEQAQMQSVLRYAAHVEDELHKARQAQREWDGQRGNPR